MDETTGGRIRRIRLRIRGGKIQRQVKASNVKGYTLRGGTLHRMSTTERLHRRRGARKGKLKRRAKMARTKLKRMRSMRRRHQMGM